MAQRKEEKVMIGICFQKLTLKKPVEFLAGLAGLYKRDARKVSQKRTSPVSSKTHCMFRATHDSYVHHTWRNHTITIAYFRSVYQALQHEIMKDNTENVS